MSPGTVDAIQAALRYITVLIGAAIALFGFLQHKDLVGLFNYVQTHGGETLAAVTGLISIGTMIFGIFKTHKRGNQAAGQ